MHVAQGECQTWQHVCVLSALTKHSPPGSCVMSTLCLTDLLLHLSPTNPGASDVPSVHRPLVEQRTAEGHRFLGQPYAKKMFSVIAGGAHVGTDELYIDSGDQCIMLEYVFNETERENGSAKLYEAVAEVEARNWQEGNSDIVFHEIRGEYEYQASRLPDQAPRDKC